MCLKSASLVAGKSGLFSGFVGVSVQWDRYVSSNSTHCKLHLGILESAGIYAENLLFLALGLLS